MDYKQLTLESFEYIKNNLDVNSNDVPMHLIDFWLVKDIKQLMANNYMLDNNSNHLDIFLFA